MEARIKVGERFTGILEKLVQENPTDCILSRLNEIRIMILEALADNGVKPLSSEDPHSNTRFYMDFRNRRDSALLDPRYCEWLEVNGETLYKEQIFSPYSDIAKDLIIKVIRTVDKDTRIALLVEFICGGKVDLKKLLENEDTKEVYETAMKTLVNTKHPAEETRLINKFAYLAIERGIEEEERFRETLAMLGVNLEERRYRGNAVREKVANRQFEHAYRRRDWETIVGLYERGICLGHEMRDSFECLLPRCCLEDDLTVAQYYRLAAALVKDHQEYIDQESFFDDARSEIFRCFRDFTNDVIGRLKYICDPAIFKHIVDTDGEDFKIKDEKTRLEHVSKEIDVCAKQMLKDIIAFAKKMSEGLASTPVVIERDQLREGPAPEGLRGLNKFILCVSCNGKIEFTIGTANLTHSQLMSSGDEFLGGGCIDVIPRDESDIVVTIRESSSRSYSIPLIKFIKDQLVTMLSRKYPGKNIIVQAHVLPVGKKLSNDPGEQFLEESAILQL